MIKNFKFLFSLEQITLILLGQKQSRKAESKFGNKVRESRKLGSFYGKLPLRYLQKIIRKSGSSLKTYQRNERLFTVLESRLDVVLYRSGFFESIATAKQWILSHGVNINKKKVVSPGTIIVPGDVISVLKTTQSSVEREESCTARNRNKNFAEQSEKRAVAKLRFALTQFSLLRPICKNENLSFINKSLLFVQKIQQKQISSIVLSKDSKKGKTVFALKKKQVEWRFKASSFRISLLKPFTVVSNHFSKKITTFLEKWIDLHFSKSKQLFFRKQYCNSVRENLFDLRSPKIIYPKNSVENKLSFVSHLPSLKERGRAIQCAKQSFPPQELLQGVHGLAKQSFASPSSLSTKTKLPTKTIFDENEKEKGSLVLAFLFGAYKLFLKKQFISSTRKKRKFKTRRNALLQSSPIADLSSPKTKEVIQRITKQSFDRQTERGGRAEQSDFTFFAKQSLERNSKISHNTEVHKKHKTEYVKRKKRPFRFKFLPTYLLNLKKKKASCLLKQRSTLFFKEQFFFAAKKVKPLHLEISYRSVSVIFLFSPQHIYFPFFINISQIYK